MNRILFLLLFPTLIFGAPKGAKVSHGKAQVSHHGNEMRIQTSHHAVIDWESFSIEPGETTRFIQPHSHSAVINRVCGSSSQIEGNLFANGRVYLLNPNGVLVGKNGIVSCAAFAATTLNFDSEECFKGGELLFKGSSIEKIVNCGKIEALNGDVLLLARVVVNEGVVLAKEGIAGIAAANEVLFKPSDVQNLYICPQGDGSGQLENRGMIEAAHEELRADGNVYRMAINQSGVVEANTLRTEGGQLILTASDDSVSKIGSDPILGKVSETRASSGVSNLQVSDLSPLEVFLSNLDQSRVPINARDFQEIFQSMEAHHLDGSPVFQSVCVSSSPCLTALPATYYTKAGQLFAEMFQKLQTYDELLFSCKCFLFGYDKACYDQLFHPKGMVSSFDLFNEERKCMLRQKYRNYELKYVESF